MFIDQLVFLKMFFLINNCCKPKKQFVIISSFQRSAAIVFDFVWQHRNGCYHKRSWDHALYWVYGYLIPVCVYIYTGEYQIEKLGRYYCPQTQAQCTYVVSIMQMVPMVRPSWRVMIRGEEVTVSL